MTQNMRRRTLLAGALAAAGLSGATRVDAQGGKLKIALVLKSLTDPYTVAMADAAQNYQQHYASQFGLTIRGTVTTGCAFQSCASRGLAGDIRKHAKLDGWLRKLMGIDMSMSALSSGMQMEMTWPCMTRCAIGQQHAPAMTLSNNAAG
ncbi:hypothetical protein LMG28614_00475 [Paraburkholderia ultramafica]|uniref:Uncharacterized protein n=1 Tax=Paraburkholderia ultramafica TaxID=1544867 RepID=A0A6S7AUQ6_9BURK|nr:hypothetical protein LMG28614_00475 [Paraburkholderia ultramafica]